VVQYDGAHPTNSQSESLAGWLADGRPRIVALIAAAFEAIGAESRGALHAQLTADKLVVAAREAGRWQFEHPGPDDGASDRLSALFEAFTRLAEEDVAVVESGSRDDIRALSDKLETAIAALYEEEHVVDEDIDTGRDGLPSLPPGG
jgi:hypothetical protein